MQQPPGFKEHGTNLVTKLRKALYELRQGGHTWYEMLCCILTDLGFKCAESDFGVFYAHLSNTLIIIAIHIDDCTITGISQPLLNTYKARINAKYAITDLGPISWLLGIEVKHNHTNCTISLCQKSYIESILA